MTVTTILNNARVPSTITIIVAISMCRISIQLVIIHILITTLALALLTTKKTATSILLTTI
jgi:hypothetical protein